MSEVVEFSPCVVGWEMVEFSPCAVGWEVLIIDYYPYQNLPRYFIASNFAKNPPKGRAFPGARDFQVCRMILQAVAEARWAEKGDHL